MQNIGLDESKAEIQITRRNINYFRYADNTTIIAKGKEEQNSLLMKMKEENDKADLKLNIHKTEINGIQSHHFMANVWGKNKNEDRLRFLGLRNQCRWWL